MNSKQIADLYITIATEDLLYKEASLGKILQYLNNPVSNTAKSVWSAMNKPLFVRKKIPSVTGKAVESSAGVTGHTGTAATTNVPAAGGSMAADAAGTVGKEVARPSRLPWMVAGIGTAGGAAGGAYYGHKQTRNSLADMIDNASFGQRAKLSLALALTPGRVADSMRG